MHSGPCARPPPPASIINCQLPGLAPTSDVPACTLCGLGSLRRTSRWFFWRAPQVVVIACMPSTSLCANVTRHMYVYVCVCG